MTRSEEQAALAKGVWCDSYNFYLKYHGAPLISSSGVRLQKIFGRL